MGLRTDLRVLRNMAFYRRSGSTHAERLENFYGKQARDYDEYRKKLLCGREELYRSIAVPKGGVWVDLGGGTGWNIENLADSIGDLRKVWVVDLSTSLLNVAADRFRGRGWNNVETRVADATVFEPPDGPADVVTFSYSLTMMPDWFRAIDNALRILRPGGTIGVVDFYVSRKHPDAGMKRHGSFTRTFWPWFFAIDNVYPSSEHLPYLRSRFETMSLTESRGKVPYIPFLRMPWYRFVGKRKA